MKKATVTNTFLTRYLPAGGWACLTAGALLMKGDTLEDAGWWFEIPDWLEALARELQPGADKWADKLVHFVLFFVLAWLVQRCFPGTDGDSAVERRTLAVTLPYIVVLYAGQIPIPGRGWETLDVLAGFAGAAAALALLRLVKGMRRE